ncbi:MAG TPA: alpha/beta fold hydrolase, partial [Acidimicrobiia bacterium]|nr:alpha/beta fold hydrolase [Acidimicrobiia bacterium]
MRVTVDDGVELEVVRRGEGLPLLLVHGFGGLKEDFADHLDALAVDHEVVAFDHRGHGESGKTGDPSSYSLKRMAADVLAVADACGFDRFRLLGFSMGGMVVQHVVLDAPQRIDALVLMGTCPG